VVEAFHVQRELKQDDEARRQFAPEIHLVGNANVFLTIFGLGLAT
jgi:hypothetical protein